MDSIEALLNQVSLSQNQKKNKQQKQKLKANNHMADQYPKELFFAGSPLSPIFKPLKSPMDLLPEINLPLSDLSTDETEDFNSSNDSKKKIFYTSGRELNVFLHGNSLDNSSEFQMVDANLGQNIPLEDVKLSPKNAEAHKETSEPVSAKISILQFLDKKAL